MARNENILTNLPKEFKSMLTKVVQQVLIDRGVKKNSSLINSIEFTDNSRDSIYMMVNDYYSYVSTGRKPKAKKVPLYALIQWIKKTGMVPRKGQTYNQLAFLIQRSIYMNGLKGRNFINVVKSTVSDTVEAEVGDMLEELVADALFSSFQIK